MLKTTCIKDGDTLNWFWRLKKEMRVEACHRAREIEKQSQYDSAWQLTLRLPTSIATSGVYLSRFTDDSLRSNVPSHSFAPFAQLLSLEVSELETYKDSDIESCQQPDPLKGPGTLGIKPRTALTHIIDGTHRRLMVEWDGGSVLPYISGSEHCIRHMAYRTNGKDSPFTIAKGMK